MTACTYQAGLPPVPIATYHADLTAGCWMEWHVPREFLDYLARAWPDMPVLSEFGSVLTLAQLMGDSRQILHQYSLILQPLADGGFVGRVRGCPGVIAFGETRQACAAETRSVLREWEQQQTITEVRR